MNNGYNKRWRDLMREIEQHDDCNIRSAWVRIWKLGGEMQVVVFVGVGPEAVNSKFPATPKGIRLAIEFIRSRRKQIERGSNVTIN